MIRAIFGINWSRGQHGRRTHVTTSLKSLSDELLADFGVKLYEAQKMRGFLKTTNKAVFECRGEKIKEYIGQSLTSDQAIKNNLTLTPSDLI